MSGNMRVIVGSGLGVLLVACLCVTGIAQEVATRPEVVPTPPPATPSAQNRMPTPYGPMQAVQDAYRMAEQQRRMAVQRQTQLLQSAWAYHPWAVPYVPVVPRVAVPYVPAVPRVYGYLPRRAAIRAYRHGYRAAPQVSVQVYPYPYSTWAREPTGYGQVWVGPNSYTYRPYYGQPAQQPTTPTPAAPSTRPALPTEQPPGPALSAPIRPAPEQIPAPPADPAPQ